MTVRRSGFSLLEVLVAVSMLALSAVVIFRFAIATTTAVAVGRRWSAMAWAIDGEVARLAREYRAGRPGCVPPPGGTRYTADAVGLDWRVRGDAILIRLVVSARAGAAGRSLVDSVVTAVSCR